MATSKGNANWTAIVNVAGVKARSPGGSYVEPATGAYKVKITGTEQYDKDGKSSVMVQTVIVGGEYDGSEGRIYLGLDLSKPGNQRSWRSALLSIGFTEVDLDAGDMAVGAETLNGADAFIYVKAKDQDDASSQTQRDFLTPAQYAQLTASSAPTAPAVNAPTAIRTAAPVAPAAVPAAPVVAPAAAPAMTVPQPTGAGARLRGMSAARPQ